MVEALGRRSRISNPGVFTAVGIKGHMGRASADVPEIPGMRIDMIYVRSAPMSRSIKRTCSTAVG